MTDIHTHILPGVDDGAKDIQTSIKMLEMESEQGVDTIYLTPHFGGPKNQREASELKEHFASFIELPEVKRLQLDLRLGSELLYHKSLGTELEKGIALTMDGSDHILLEFYPKNESKLIINGCRDLYNCGYSIILAHVERYQNIDQHDIDMLCQMDVLLQMNASYANNLTGPVLGRKRWHKKLLKEGYISFIASDTHNAEERSPDLHSANINRHFPGMYESLHG